MKVWLSGFATLALASACRTNGSCPTTEADACGGQCMFDDIAGGCVAIEDDLGCFQPTCLCPFDYELAEGRCDFPVTFGDGIKVECCPLETAPTLELQVMDCEFEQGADCTIDCDDGHVCEIQDIADSVCVAHVCVPVVASVTCGSACAEGEDCPPCPADQVAETDPEEHCDSVASACGDNDCPTERCNTIEATGCISFVSCDADPSSEESTSEDDQEVTQEPVVSDPPAQQISQQLVVASPPASNLGPVSPADTPETQCLQNDEVCAPSPCGNNEVCIASTFDGCFFAECTIQVQASTTLPARTTSFLTEELNSRPVSPVTGDASTPSNSQNTPREITDSLCDFSPTNACVDSGCPDACIPTQGRDGCFVPKCAGREQVDTTFQAKETVQDSQVAAAGAPIGAIAGSIAAAMVVAGAAVGVYAHSRKKRNEKNGKSRDPEMISPFSHKGYAPQQTVAPPLASIDRMIPGPGYAHPPVGTSRYNDDSSITTGDSSYWNAAQQASMSAYTLDTGDSSDYHTDPHISMYSQSSFYEPPRGPHGPSGLRNSEVFYEESDFAQESDFDNRQSTYTSFNNSAIAQQLGAIGGDEYDEEIQYSNEVNEFIGDDESDYESELVISESEVRVNDGRMSAFTQISEFRGNNYSESDF